MTYYHIAKQIQLSLQIIRRCFSWSPDPPMLGEGVKMLRGWIECEARTDLRKAGKGYGEGLGEHLQKFFLKIHTWNRAIWCIVEAKIYIFINLFLLLRFYLLHSWARSQNAARSLNWGHNPKRGQSPRVSGEDLGRGLGEPLPRKCLKIFTWNRAIWCIVNNVRKILFSYPYAVMANLAIEREWVWRGGSVSPFPDKVRKFILEIVHSATIPRLGL